jgi:DNA helicase-2/ATP-dependent DNA helicase PcrA
MTPEPAEELARARRAFIVAAAGCGKTETVARAAGIHCSGRQLVLTHTHAGVKALKDRLVRVNADKGRVHVDTIAGFALRYAASFPNRSELPSPLPSTTDQWNATYDAARRVLESSFGRTVLEESYAGLFVDEYQDCIEPQHQLVMTMAQTLPCRVVLDPLQGIFDWAGPVVSCDRDLAPSFERLPDLVTPHRWRPVNPELGEWLTEVRGHLLAARPIDLTNAPIRRGGIDVQSQSRECMDVYRAGGSAVAIGKWRNECYSIARRLLGRYTVMEPVECPDLMEWAGRLGTSTSFTRAGVLIEFAAVCMTEVGTALRTASVAFRAGHAVVLRANTANRSVVEALNTLALDGGLPIIGAAMREIEAMPGVVLHRRELWSEMKRAVAACPPLPPTSLRDAAWRVRDSGRNGGRRVELRTVSRTVLVKGLEFDRAIVLNADGLDKRNLYVAITRGSKSLSVLAGGDLLRSVD